jgi:uncharacterized protein with von Willebrand factor type A (vWA) domain
MSDVINIGDFKNKKKEEDRDIEEVFLERIMDETSNPDKETEYTEYKDKAAQMLIEVIATDAHTWQQNNNTTLCSWDYKDILSRAMINVLKLEQEHLEEEFKDMSDEELLEELQSELKTLREIFGQGEDTEPEGGE